MIDFKDVSAASRQIATNSAMNPILWLAAIASTVLFICAAFAAPPLNYLMFALGALPVLVACCAYAYFAITNPDRLQSERHIEKMTVLARMGSRRSGGREIVIPQSAPTINNPILGTSDERDE